jgi:hypothetical protein
VKLFFDYETSSLIDDVLESLSPTKPVSVAELQIFDASTQHHVKQIERMRVPQVDSAAGRAIPMMAILDEPGTYVADGGVVSRVEKTNAL